MSTSLPYSPGRPDSQALSETEKHIGIDIPYDRTHRSSHTFGAWVHTTWALIAHFILSVGTVGFVLFYVDNESFNLTERSPFVKTIHNSIKTPFRPTQSDIVTILSSMIVTVRSALAAWVTALCWRAALFLMERGLPRRDLKTLISFGVLSPRMYQRDAVTFLIGTFLLASMLSGLVSPLLTGSIYWAPSNQLAWNLPTPPAEVTNSDFSIQWENYKNNTPSRSVVIQKGLGMVNIGWGRDIEQGTLKRVIPSLSDLAIDSTVENVTLPYFAMHNLEWISNPEESLTKDERNFTTLNQKMADFSPTGTFTLDLGSVVLIPSESWSSDSGPITSNTTVTDTRLLMLYHSFNVTALNESQPMRSIFYRLPPNMGIVSQENKVYSFARVSFSAGVGRCEENKCIISAPLTVQNNTFINLQPDRLTQQSLALAPSVAQFLSSVNSSIPFPLNGTRIDDYIEAVLVRSYSGAWNALNDFTGEWSRPLLSNYTPAWECLKAKVDKRRVYAWLGVQLLVTFLGAVFLFIQAHSKHPLIGDTVLTAFYLDTTEVPKKQADSRFQRDSVLKVEKGGERYKVTVENTSGW
ncbi:unnamed protein product [Rhizoctonia solani]|uniref:Transmembrane protein n=1 Tax=Rhizoctonia solani TaxID=456999 RepID=A0A8H3B1S5_9AGAM|nr:unnamed protein product [Rhizoctonia solani]